MRILKGSLLFLAGVVLTAAFFVSTDLVPSALADKYACIRQDLDAQLMDGYPPQNERFTIAYAVPTCYGTQGYKVDRTYIYGGNMVAVTYQKQ